MRFFPWTSDAIAPPTVTNFVPGVTGRNHPLARKIQRSPQGHPCFARQQTSLSWKERILLKTIRR